jgi:hypothetical protein
MSMRAPARCWTPAGAATALVALVALMALMALGNAGQRWLADDPRRSGISAAGAEDWHDPNDVAGERRVDHHAAPEVDADVMVIAEEEDEVAGL